jgi:two-component system, sporulation sensor kinase B
MIKISNNKLIWLSLFFFLMGLTMPHWFSSGYKGLHLFISNMQKTPNGNTLLLIAFSLVMFNTIHVLPVYLGAVLLGDQIGARLKRNWIKLIIPLTFIPLSYIITNSFIRNKYHFGSGSILILLFVILLYFLEKGRLNMFMKSLILVQILFGVQWLDEVPFLTNYGFGHGSISTKVKLWAIEMGFSQALSLYAILLCSIFLLNAFILTGYLVRWQVIQELHLIKLQALEARSDREVLSLVHDLKTPLASIEGLISLIDLYNKNGKVKEYCDNITNSIKSMNDMISEILYNSHMSSCSLNELIDYILSSRLSGTNKKVYVEVPDNPEEIKILINKVRITRAVVNLINNAFDALMEYPEGKVTIKAKVQGNKLSLGVSDNGKGMNIEEQEEVWKAGYSTKHQSGIGLSFVYQVAKEHKGTVSLESNLEQGTTFWIHLRGGRSDENLSH